MNEDIKKRFEERLEALSDTADYSQTISKQGGVIAAQFVDKEIITLADAKTLWQFIESEINKAKPQWISVKDKPPDGGVKVTAHYRNSLGKGRTIMAKYLPKHFEEGDSEDLELEYNEEADKFYYPEGWYEYIENWGEYSFVTVTEGEVTHWALLMEPPPTGEPRTSDTVVVVNIESVTKLMQAEVKVNFADIKEVLREAFDAGRTVKNYKGEWVDDLDLDTYTSAKYRDFDKWYISKISASYNETYLPPEVEETNSLPVEAKPKDWSENGRNKI